MKQIDQNAQNTVCKVLVGNKCDRDERKVSFEDGQSLAKEVGMKFFETSAKTNYNVNETFTYLTREILNKNERVAGGSTQGIELGKTDSNPKKGKKECCK